ncbi:type IX secretion system membrane protein PorP/SprF [Fulvivirga ulvae]|uniref:PorP/SprF family type IX secretion system membrane protein n=1 Tax=Fulvivirga ulvae TaxID=2904245 RepID=UPI001F331DD3|nr:type IX secretion system membrane protein PorP/SprF [Fulvivirga ulvae]UII30119.1 type IX secretion system membrane protein PorP/SprF [Fulvivirga ulvae]
MKSKRFIIVAILLFVSLLSNGQQQVMFTQYMFNGLALNPAYAGSHETVSITALAREQWTGIDGAPSTQTLSIHSPVFNQRIGVGLLFLHDEIGVTEQTGVYAAYSYKIPFANGADLALGLQAGFTSYNARFSKVSDINPAFANGDVQEMHPNFGFGAYYSTERFYVGFSVPQLAQNTFDKDNKDSDSRIIRHYFATTGYVFDLNRNLKLKPNLLVKAVDGAPVEFDLNTNLLINEVVWLGLSWRSFDSFDALFQLQVTDRLQLGYAYDFATTSDLRRVNGGSHEVMLNYRFSLTSKRIVTPRYF